VKLRNPEQRALIIGSCHTFPGRFAICAEGDQRTQCASKYQIVDCSPEAAYWLRGFLEGSVPAYDEERWSEDEWHAGRASFLETGE
jgi:hypothetical protein